MKESKSEQTVWLHLKGLFLTEKSVVEACMKTVKIIYQSGKAPCELVYEVIALIIVLLGIELGQTVG